MEEARSRIYNTVMDDLTRMLAKEGYKVYVSLAYPEGDDPKYIIWHNEGRKDYLIFALDREADSFELLYATGNEAPEVWSTGWQYLHHEQYYATMPEHYTEEVIQDTIEGFGMMTTRYLKSEDVGTYKLKTDEPKQPTYQTIKIFILIVSLGVSLVKLLTSSHRDREFTVVYPKELEYMDSPTTVLRSDSGSYRTQLKRDSNGHWYKEVVTVTDE